MPPINEAGIARYDALVAHAREKGVKIAFENLRYLENLALLMDRYPDMGFCWDTGHERCYTPDVRYMPLYGNRTIALHVHDNDFHRDAHTLPFMGAHDWNAITDALADIRYKGEFTLEADNFLARLPRELLPQACAMMCSVARYLAGEIERKMALQST